MPQDRLIQVETNPAKVWYQGGTGQATALSHPLPARVLDQPTEELSGDSELLDGVEDDDRRAT